MARDHYVPQVHLRKFCSPALEGERLFAIRKADASGKIFSTPLHTICSIENGNTNPFLEQPRAVEDFLREIEPAYDAALAELVGGSCSSSAREILSGYVAGVLACAPAMRRIGTRLLRDMLNRVSRMLDRSGMMPPPPPELGASSLTELLDRGAIRAEIDPQFPQAFGMGNVRAMAHRFALSSWEILRNEHDDNPFFTSDLPVPLDDGRRLAPLSPSIAIRIDAREPASHRFMTLTRHEVTNVNRLIVQTAEDLVMFRDNRAWVSEFVAKNRRIRVHVI